MSKEPNSAGWTQARVALDIDSVLAETIEACRRTAAAQVERPLHEVTFSGDYYDSFRHADPDVQQTLRAVVPDLWELPQTLLGARPLPGALALARRLAADGRLAGYVTRRPSRVEALTEEWLAAHGFPRGSGVELRHVGDRQECKSVTALALGAQILVEDNASEAQSALSNGMWAVLVDMPYNAHAAPDLLRRHRGALRLSARTAEVARHLW